jgi:hypothetical protein
MGNNWITIPSDVYPSLVSSLEWGDFVRLARTCKRWDLCEYARVCLRRYQALIVKPHLTLRRDTTPHWRVSTTRIGIKGLDRHTKDIDPFVMLSGDSDIEFRHKCLQTLEKVCAQGSMIKYDVVAAIAVIDIDPFERDPFIQEHPTIMMVVSTSVPIGDFLGKGFAFETRNAETMYQAAQDRFDPVPPDVAARLREFDLYVVSDRMNNSLISGIRFGAGFVCPGHTMERQSIAEEQIIANKGVIDLLWTGERDPDPGQWIEKDYDSDSGACSQIGDLAQMKM